MEEQKTQGRGSAEPNIGPGTYKINYGPTEDKLPNWTVPKDPFNNFIDKATRETMIDKKKMKEMPGPGTYPLQGFDLNKLSRGTMHASLRGISRSTMSGYF